MAAQRVIFNMLAVGVFVPMYSSVWALEVREGATEGAYFFVRSCLQPLLSYAHIIVCQHTTVSLFFCDGKKKKKKRENNTSLHISASPCKMEHLYKAPLWIT